MEKWPIGVFASVDAGLGVHFDVVQELQIPTVQLHAPSPEARKPESAEAFRRQCDDAGVAITAVFGGFFGESYASIAETARCVGLVPQETRAERAGIMKEIADFTKMLGCDTVALHIGFLPASSDPDWQAILDCTRDLLDHIAGNGQKLHLETGQETAEHLLEFIHAVERDNLFINFDPANMILYGTGEPIAALRSVGQFVRSVHCKDATWASEDVRGREWGAEVPLGEGDVDFEAYLKTLDEFGYTGPLTIEREIPEDRERQKADIGKAVAVLQDLKQKLA